MPQSTRSVLPSVRPTKKAEMMSTLYYLRKYCFFVLVIFIMVGATILGIRLDMSLLQNHQTATPLSGWRLTGNITCTDATGVVAVTTAGFIFTNTRGEVFHMMKNGTQLGGIDATRSSGEGQFLGQIVDTAESGDEQLLGAIVHITESGDEQVLGKNNETWRIGDEQFQEDRNVSRGNEKELIPAEKGNTRETGKKQFLEEIDDTRGSGEEHVLEEKDGRRKSADQEQVIDRTRRSIEGQILDGKDDTNISGEEQIIVEKDDTGGSGEEHLLREIDDTSSKEQFLGLAVNGSQVFVADFRKKQLVELRIEDNGSLTWQSQVQSNISMYSVSICPGSPILYASVLSETGWKVLEIEDGQIVRSHVIPVVGNTTLNTFIACYNSLYVAVSVRNQSVEIYQVTANGLRHRHSIRHITNPGSVAFLPSGHLLVVAGDTALYVLEPSSWRQVALLEMPAATDLAFDVAVWPDGSLVVTSMRDTKWMILLYMPV